MGNGNMSCCRFRGHQDKIVTKKLESGWTRRKFSREFKIEAVRLVCARPVGHSAFFCGLCSVPV